MPMYAGGRQPRRPLVPRYTCTEEQCAPPAPHPPEPPSQSELPFELPDASILNDLLSRIKSLDAETLLLLGILWLLWQEKADRRLLLALAYIVL